MSEDIKADPIQDERSNLLRLVLVSSKIRNATAFQAAFHPGVVLLQYQYENSTLASLLGMYLM